MNRLGIKVLLWCALPALTGRAQSDTTLTYRVEASANVSSGDYAPLWFTANRNGLSSQKPNSAYLRAGLTYRKSFNHGWRIGAGLDLAAAVNSPSEFIVQQAYADFSWRVLNLSIGNKERNPLGKNPLLSSGGMVEGNNARPVPQVGQRLRIIIRCRERRDGLLLKAISLTDVLRTTVGSVILRGQTTRLTWRTFFITARS